MRHRSPYYLTPLRHAALRKAQLSSARKRRARSRARKRIFRTVGKGLVIGAAAYGVTSAYHKPQLKKVG